MKPYLIGVGIIAIIVGLYFYGESREEDGYNKAIAESQKAIEAWEKAKKAEYSKALKEEKAKQAKLESDLSNLQSDYAALQSEVSNVPVTKPAVPGVPDCTGYNPFTDHVARVLNLGAGGAIGAAKAAAGSGDGKVPEATGTGSR